MKRARSVTIKMSRKDALRFGLLVCQCGHRENQHNGECYVRDGDFCKCKSYCEKPVVGKFV